MPSAIMLWGWTSQACPLTQQQAYTITCMMDVFSLCGPQATHLIHKYHVVGLVPAVRILLEGEVAGDVEGAVFYAGAHSTSFLFHEAMSSQ